MLFEIFEVGRYRHRIAGLVGELLAVERDRLQPVRPGKPCRRDQEWSHLEPDPMAGVGLEGVECFEAVDLIQADLQVRAGAERGKGRVQAFLSRHRLH